MDEKKQVDAGAAAEGGNGPRTQEVARIVEETLGRVGAVTEKLSADVKAQLTAQADQVASFKSRLEEQDSKWRERFELHGRRQHENRDYRGHFADPQQAKLFGLLVLAKSHPDTLQRAACADEFRRLLPEVQRAAISEKTGELGGFLTIETFLPGLLANVDTYGATERLFRVWPEIGSTTVSRARRSQGAMVYYPDYGGKPDESVLKVAKLQAELTRHSVFCRYDSWMAQSNLVVALAEYVADEMARALALAQDSNGFMGDGTPAYARTVGVFKTPAAGHLQIIAGSGDATFQKIIDAANKYLAKALAQLPRWAHQAGPLWLMDHTIFFGFWGLQDATGKPIVQFLGGDAPTPFRLMGYPVEFTGVGPGIGEATQNNRAVIAVGAFNRGWEIYRHRAGFKLRISEHVYFLEGDTAVVLDVPQTIAEIDPNCFVNIVTANS